MSRWPRPGATRVRRPSYARHFVGELFLATFEPLGLHPELYWMSEVYAAGDMDRYIRAALDAAETIRTIYREVDHVEKEAGWLPVSVICTNCGQVDGRHRLGRGDRGLRLPPGPGDVGHRLRLLRPGGAVRGQAKLPFNVDWAAKWSLFGITIEGSARTSPPPVARDRSDAIARQVFDREPPMNVPHEFINVGGR